jgi:hypothetical protein
MNKVKILIDADVLIHLFKAEKISILNMLFPGRLIMLDVVLNELRSNRTINASLAGIFTFSGIEEVVFPTTSNKALLFEFIQLKKQLGGAGESATLLYCKHNTHIIASSNTKDIVPYCTANGMSYLTTLDIFAIAIHRGLMTEAEVNAAIAQITQNSGSHLCCSSISQHITTHFDVLKYSF